MQRSTADRLGERVGAAKAAATEASRTGDVGQRPRQEPVVARQASQQSIGNQALLRRRNAWPPPPDPEVMRGVPAAQPALVKLVAPGPIVSRDADDDEIEAIEAEKLEIHALLDRCAALDPGQRDRMIGKVGDHAATTHEERQLACLLAAKFTGKMLRADFYNTYHARCALSSTVMLPGLLLTFAGPPWSLVLNCTPPSTTT